MLPNTAFNVGLTMLLTSVGFFVLVWALNRQVLLGFAITCFVLAVVAFTGAAVGHYRPPAPTGTTGNLGLRAIALSDEIIREICSRGLRFPECEEIRQTIPLALRQEPPGRDASADVVETWRNDRARYFILKFYQDVGRLRDEFAHANLRDKDLDRILEVCERAIETNRAFAEAGSAERSYALLAPSDYVVVARSLRELSRGA